MIFPLSFEEKLGVDIIRQRLKSYCLSPEGSARVDQMQFITDVAWIKTLLKQTLEFRQILEKSEDFPARFFFDGSDWLKRISLQGNYLESEEFLKLSQALETILACRNFLIKSKETYPELSNLSQPVTITAELPKLIQLKIDDRGIVKDNASPEMARIRRRLREEQSQLRRLADVLFRKAVEEQWVPDGALPTIRDGRLVIPVQSEHKRKLKGFILDESASGQTVFIEPAEMLDVNNEIRDLEYAEKRELILILKSLTDQMRIHLPALTASFKFLALIDFIRAKAKFALEINADLPIIEGKPELTWYNARHPLLYLAFKDKQKVIPLNIELDPGKRFLLLSGPNAGGKSVALKTIGLLQYMVQCGLLIPLSDRSRVGIFQDIFLDIGDQQSIENDLSTYSSHLKNLGVFLRSSSDQSLVLMDELGSGTDPNFGGAIAQAVLEELLKKKVWGLATTHYYNLKLFAGQKQGIVNASMRFDDTNMVPLYVLDIGKPGSSYALEIARKTGLPESTLTEAEKLVGKDLAGFETLVRNLEKEQQTLSEKIKQMEQQEKVLKQSLSRYQSLTTDLESKKKEIIGKAREDAAELLRETNREIEKTIRHIRENRAERTETSKVRKNLQLLSKKVAQPQTEKKEKSKEPLREGDHVRIIGQDVSGVVLTIKGKNASVQFGELKSTINLSRLEKVSASVAKQATPRTRVSGVSLHEKQASFNTTLDIRGKRVEEAIPLLDQFLDTAILLGHGELRILHGKGEGILRKVIREQLRKYKEVASVRDEHVERGGDGITVIVLK